MPERSAKAFPTTFFRGYAADTAEYAADTSVYAADTLSGKRSPAALGERSQNVLHTRTLCGSIPDNVLLGNALVADTAEYTADTAEYAADTAEYAADTAEYAADTHTVKRSLSALGERPQNVHKLF